jgi:hypothetical protein
MMELTLEITIPSVQTKDKKKMNMMVVLLNHHHMRDRTLVLLFLNLNSKFPYSGLL